MIAELAMATIEQPSPVSVLDATFYIEDSPSPVKKKISIAFGGNNLIPQNMYFFNLNANWNRSLAQEISDKAPIIYTALQLPRKKY